jgi:L-threonylcarbamoyladenylate synthase
MTGGESVGKKTRVLALDPARPDSAGVREAARCLARGGLIVFPTETVYGLGADAGSSEAVARVFAAKGRPANNPLIVHVCSPDDTTLLAREVDARARALMDAFWPGPLSLIFRRTARIAPEVSCGLDTVAIRMPDHPVALALIRQSGVPVAAPSANTSGRPSPTRAEDALADLQGRVDYVLDAGPCPVGVESTVLDITGPVAVVLRPGGVTVEQLRAVIGEVRLLDQGGFSALSGVGPDDSTEASPTRSPGLRHRHYAPRAKLIAVLPTPSGKEIAPTGDPVAAAVAYCVAQEMAAGRRTGVAVSRETAESLGWIRALAGGLPPVPFTPAPVVVWGGRSFPREIAAGLFSALRDLDLAGVETIVAEGLWPEGIGLAVNDRLARAAAVVIPVTGSPFPAEVACGLILIVCSGNTCRSPLGAVILRRALAGRGLGAVYSVLSAGTAAAAGHPATSEACLVASERGLDLSRHRSSPLSAVLLAQAGLILTMTSHHRQTVLELCPTAAGRVFTLKDYAGGEPDEDIPDPICRGLEAYRRVADDLERTMTAVVERLIPSPGLGPPTG